MLVPTLGKINLYMKLQSIGIDIVFFCLGERWLQLYEICLLASSSSHEKVLITVVALVILILISQKKHVYRLGKVLSPVDLFCLLLFYIDSVTYFFEDFVLCFARCCGV